MSCENCLARRRSRMKEQQRKSEEEDAEAAIAKHEEDRSPAAGEENLGAAPYRCTLITVGASWPQAVHGRLSRCKRLPLILDRASTPAWLATLRPVRPPGSELRLLPNQSRAARWW